MILLYGGEVMSVQTFRSFISSIFKKFLLNLILEVQQKLAG